MASANPYAAAGTGGKMRRRPARAQPTPYDRPPAAARTPLALPPADASNRWISKLVDPASRFITGSASKLFSSVFRKTLPAPPPTTASASSPEEMHQEGEEEPVPQLISAETPANREQDETLAERDPDETPDEIKSVFEIEQLLAQKTFTKGQCEHLTEMLRARIVEPSLSEPAQINKGQEVDTNIPHREYVAESSRKNVMFAAPASTVLIPKEEVASPMELAKAYMSSKSSKISPTTLRLRTPAFVERKTDVPNSIVPRASPKPPNNDAITPRPSSYLLDQVKDGYPTPRSLGRTAISRMCRSPFVKSGGFSSSGYETKSSPYDLPTGSTPGNKLALKRGSSALYDEIGSVGPIRRIRQKLNMRTPLKESVPSPYKNFVPTHASALEIDTNHASTSTQKDRRLTKLNQANDVSSCKDVMDDSETEPELTSIPLAPPRSTETAMKILDQLGKIVQSPKDKRSETPVLEIEAPSSQKQDKLKVNLSKLAKYDGNISFQGNNVGGSMESAKIGKSVSDGTLSSVEVPKSTKPGFRMSLPEDFLDDDEEESNEKVETTVPVKNVFHKVDFGTSKEGKESKLPEEKGTAASEAKAAPAATSKPDNNILSSPSVGESNTLFKFSSAPTASPIAFDFPSVPVSSTSSLGVLAKKDAKPPSPIFSTGLKQQDQPETPVFPWTSGKTGVEADSRQPTTEASDSDRSRQKRKSEDECKPTESAAPSASPSLATQVPVKPAFVFGGSSSPSLSNGSTHSSPKFSLSTVPDVTPTTQAASTSLTTASIRTGANVSSPPEIPKLPFVQFGANNAASSQTLASPLLDDSSAKASDTKTVKPVIFGSSPNVSTAGEIQNTAATSAGALTTATATTGLFSSNVAGHSTSASTITPAFASGNSEKTTTPSVPAFAFGSSVTTASVTTSSPSVAVTTPVSTSTSTSTTTFTNTSVTIPSVTSGGSVSRDAITFGASSQPSSSSSQAAPFTFGATSMNSGTGIFGFGASNQNASSSTSMLSSGSSQPAFAFGASSGSIFGSKPVQPESTGTQSNLLESQSTASQSSSPFSSAVSSSVIFGASSSGFSFSSSVSTSSTFASTSQASLFGSGSSNSPSIFGTTTFGSNPSGATFTFGQSSSTPSTSFTFGAQSSNPGFSFTASGSNSTAPGFGLSNSNANSSTVFGSVSPGSNNDQMSMEDSMVDDINQVTTPNPPVPAFGQAANSVPLFGAPSSAAPAPAFHFGAQPSQSLFQPGSNLEFNAGNQFSGSGAGDKANRRIVKVRRDKQRRK